MAEAAAFDEGNTILDPPTGVSLEDCDVLNVCKGVLPNGIPVVISCWKITTEELEEITRTGRIWLMVWGDTMPPAAVVGNKAVIFPSPQRPVIEEET